MDRPTKDDRALRLVKVCDKRSALAFDDCYENFFHRMCSRTSPDRLLTKIDSTAARRGRPRSPQTASCSLETCRERCMWRKLSRAFIYGRPLWTYRVDRYALHFLYNALLLRCRHCCLTIRVAKMTELFTTRSKTRHVISSCLQRVAINSNALHKKCYALHKKFNA